MEDIKGKVALVTGAGSGIGKAAAELYAAYGAKVVVSDINIDQGENTTKSILEKGGEAFFIPADVSKQEDCAGLVSGAVGKYGRLDIAFNNAGIGGESNPIADMSIEGWQQVININLNGVFYCMKPQLQQMIKQGKGAIVNMSSILGQVGFNTAAAYVAAKHGVVGLTKTAAMEYSAQGIRVNAVGPAFINTPLLDSLSDELKQILVSQHPVGRLGEAPEVAELVVFLSSDKASFITGSYYAVDGGYLSK
ncbi:MAG: SDR family oxidoreductase [Chitinophagaceae bacterium]|nr:SDR family oxidoreductase [Chitinophagaceae bacterium]MCW5926731.1 SDR family oxidoreductase [Chitinophagaceae bacterium]